MSQATIEGRSIEVSSEAAQHPRALPPDPWPVPTIELIDPERAQEWLGRNIQNRHVKRAVVALYARDLLDDRWKFTGEAIKFSRRGTLLDGQHRLLAITQAEVPAYSLVVRGLAEDSQDVMDTGSKRTAADMLGIRGERNVQVLASAVSMIITEGNAHRRSVSNSEILSVVSLDDSIRTIACDIVPGFKFSDVITDTVAFYAYWRLMRIDPAACHQFFDQLSRGVGLTEGSPILALRPRLRRLVEKTGKGSHAYRREALACIFTAWNAWRKGETREKIQVTMVGGRVSVPEPR